MVSTQGAQLGARSSGTGEGTALDRTRFYKYVVRRGSGVFGIRLSQRQIVGIEGIFDAFAEVGDGRDSTLAFVLATAYHETGRRMEPMREGAARTDFSARRAAIALARDLGPDSAAARYSQSEPPYGHVYYRRGHIPLTGKASYALHSADAGVDLVAQPDALLDPVISARVLIRVLSDGRRDPDGLGLRHYLDRDDICGARRTAGTDDAAYAVMCHHHAFLAAIEAAGGWP